MAEVWQQRGPPKNLVGTTTDLRTSICYASQEKKCYYDVPDYQDPPPSAGLIWNDTENRLFVQTQWRHSTSSHGWGGCVYAEIAPGAAVFLLHDDPNLLYRINISPPNTSEYVRFIFLSVGYCPHILIRGQENYYGLARAEHRSCCALHYHSRNVLSLSGR